MWIIFFDKSFSLPKIRSFGAHITNEKRTHIISAEILYKKLDKLSSCGCMHFTKQIRYVLNCKLHVHK